MARTGAANPAGKPKNLTTIKREEAMAAYLFLTPAIIVFLIFLIIPILFALFISFTDWNGITPIAQRAAGASGEAVFTNQTAAAVTIPAGTVIATDEEEPARFYTTAAVTLPAGGATSVGIAAVERTAGKDSNVRRNRVTVVEGDLAGAVTVTNPAATTGGQNGAFGLVGMENYADLLVNAGIAQRDFFKALKNTIYYVLGVVPAQTILALFFAMIVNQRWLRGKGAFRTAFYFPSITSSVVISLIFMWMFTKGGLVNQVLGGIFPSYDYVTWLNDSSGLFHNVLAIFGVTRATVGEWATVEIGGLPLWDWISGPSVTMFMVMLLNTWTTIGSMMVIYLAALQNIPAPVYEAASVDGATMWQSFRRITLPLLTPTTYFVVTLGLIGTFQVFDQIFVITSGGPAKTTLTIAYIVYQNGFKNSQMGLAAASALILFVIIFALTLVQRRITSDKAVD